jgi:hypothetical protein
MCRKQFSGGGGQFGPSICPSYRQLLAATIHIAFGYYWKRLCSIKHYDARGWGSNERNQHSRRRRRHHRGKNSRNPMQSGVKAVSFLASYDPAPPHEYPASSFVPLPTLHFSNYPRDLLPNNCCDCPPPFPSLPLPPWLRPRSSISLSLSLVSSLHLSTTRSQRVRFWRERRRGQRRHPGFPGSAGCCRQAGWRKCGCALWKVSVQRHSRHAKQVTALTSYVIIHNHATASHSQRTISAHYSVDRASSNAQSAPTL